MSINQTLFLFCFLLLVLVFLWFQETDTKVLNTLLVYALALLFARLLLS